MATWNTTRSGSGKFERPQLSIDVKARWNELVYELNWGFDEKTELT